MYSRTFSRTSISGHILEKQNILEKLKYQGKKVGRGVAFQASRLMAIEHTSFNSDVRVICNNAEEDLISLSLKARKV